MSFTDGYKEKTVKKILEDHLVEDFETTPKGRIKVQKIDEKLMKIEK